MVANVRRLTLTLLSVSEFRSDRSDKVISNRCIGWRSHLSTSQEYDNFILYIYIDEEDQAVLDASESGTTKLNQTVTQTVIS